MHICEKISYNMSSESVRLYKSKGFICVYENELQCECIDFSANLSENWCDLIHDNEANFYLTANTD